MPGTEVSLLKGEHDYYRYWKFLHRLKMLPNDVDNTDPEIINALWTMMQYEDEKSESDNFKAKSQAFHSKHK